MSIPRREALFDAVQRTARHNDHVAGAIWWGVFGCYAVTVAAIGLGGVTGAVYVYLRYLYPAVADTIGPMVEAVVGLAYVFVVFLLLHSVVDRIRTWLYGGATDAGWKR